jgi:hypothetical protein
LCVVGATPLTSKRPFLGNGLSKHVYVEMNTHTTVDEMKAVVSILVTPEISQGLL